jgi:hypothetical protein
VGFEARQIDASRPRPDAVVRKLRHARAAQWEAPAIGVILCADKNDAVVKYTLPEDTQNIFAARYQLYLPTEEEILTELKREQELLERDLQLRLPAPADAE